MNKKALILAANGTEEAELVIVADLLARAEIEVTIASVHNTIDPIVCSRNVKVVPDATLESVQDNLYDVVVLPGGYKGTEEFCKSELAAKVVHRHETNLRLIAAICAAPLALKAYSKKYNIFNYKYLTSHPSVKQLLLSDSSFQYKEERVVKDENLITSRGPGTAFEFAAAICEQLVGKSKTSSLISPLMLKSNPLEPEESNKIDAIDALK